MEALGRAIAIILCATGVCFCLIFYRTASVHRQKTETVRSMTKMYSQHVLESKKVIREEWDLFLKELNVLGDYCAEITVYERRRFENESGRIFLFSEWKREEPEREFSDGSYVRVLVTEQEGGMFRTLFFGAGTTIISGGRIA